jgi:hypothetical protein
LNIFKFLSFQSENQPPPDWSWTTILEAPLRAVLAEVVNESTQNIPVIQAPLLFSCLSSPVPQPMDSAEVGAEVELGEVEEANGVPDESNPEIRPPLAVGKFCFFVFKYNVSMFLTSI